MDWASNSSPCPSTTSRRPSLHRKTQCSVPVGYGANADAVAAAVGAFTNDSPRHLQPTAFTLTPNGEILAAVYSTSATGRLVAKDLLGFVSYVKSRLATQAAL
ncbi:MAG TPA: hypothetical protein VFE60_20570 [Roseiarcus sp.]|jgi:hypothetical protein|nr:hypothetical protein [Roseiarcus sp.]